MLSFEEKKDFAVSKLHSKYSLYSQVFLVFLLQSEMMTLQH
jgi:hypothetical protein